MHNQPSRKTNKPSQAKHKQAPEQRKHRQQNRGKGRPGHWALTAERRGQVGSQVSGDWWGGAGLRRPSLAKPCWSLTSGEPERRGGTRVTRDPALLVLGFFFSSLLSSHSFSLCPLSIGLNG